MENQTNSPEPLKIDVQDSVAIEEVPAVRLLRYLSLAPKWFKDAKDAKKDADKINDPLAVRREIIFSVCLAESYLYEWVRDEVLGDKDPNTIKPYFDFPSELDSSTIGGKPSIRERWKKIIDKLCWKEKNPRKRKAGIKERWKTVIDRLHKKGKIPRKPTWGKSPIWQEFTRLVELRDGLVHAGVSRAETSDQSENERSFPTIDELQNTSNGWATEVVVGLIKELHHAVGTSSPVWVMEP